MVCTRLVNFLEEKNILSHYQAAYRRGRSTTDHILTLHEIFLEYRYNKIGARGGKTKKRLFFTFLDLKKAFDTVPRNLLFSKLMKAGISGKLFRVIRNLFSRNIANVLVDGFLSPDFIINRGVLQGSKLGPILFNVFINDLLIELNASKLGATIGKLLIAALGFADDIVLITDCPIKAQKLLDICEKWTCANEMAFNTKCKVLVLNGPHRDITLTLHGDNLQAVRSYKYLGVTFATGYVTNLFREHFRLTLEKARSRVATIRRFGFYKVGLSLPSSIRLYKSLVRPILEYGAQSLAYGRYSNLSKPDGLTGFAKDLEHFQTQTLKHLIGCSRNTSPAMVRLFCGVEPIACRLEVLKLRYYWKILNGPSDSVTSKILSYRKKNLLGFQRGFGQQVFNICCKYNAMNIWNGTVPAKVCAQIHIKRIILSNNLSRDLQAGRGINCGFTSIYLTNPFSYQKNYHLVDPFGASNFNFTNIRALVKALLDPDSYTKECLQCGSFCSDTLTHLLKDCSTLLESARLLDLKLTMYNFPKKLNLLDKTEILSLILSKNCWAKCLATFLKDSGY